LAFGFQVNPDVSAELKLTLNNSVVFNIGNFAANVRRSLTVTVDDGLVQASRNI